MSAKKWVIAVGMVALVGGISATCGLSPKTPPAATRLVEVTRLVESTPERIVEVVTVLPTPEPGIELGGLRYPLNSKPPTLDLHKASDATSHLIIQQCIDALYVYRGDGSVEPRGFTFDNYLWETYDMEADKILCEDEVAIIPLHSHNYAMLVKSGVVFEFPPFGVPRFYHWELP